MKEKLTFISFILGLPSKILPESDAYYLTLLKWLDAASSGVSDWLLCYNGSNLDAAAFHKGCDYLGATVTLVRVGDYVFGGFSNENWGGIKIQSVLDQFQILLYAYMLAYNLFQKCISESLMLFVLVTTKVSNVLFLSKILTSI